MSGVSVAYPYILANGPPNAYDASQVMANFTAINTALLPVVASASPSFTGTVTIVPFSAGPVVSSGGGVLSGKTPGYGSSIEYSAPVFNPAISAMAGLQAGVSTITPTASGNVLAVFCGTMYQIQRIALYYGSGLGPPLFSPIIGTELGIAEYQSVQQSPVALVSLVTGLTIGQQYWFDIGYEGPFAGNPLFGSNNPGFDYTQANIIAIELIG